MTTHTTEGKVDLREMRDEILDMMKSDFEAGRLKTCDEYVEMHAQKINAAFDRFELEWILVIVCSHGEQIKEEHARLSR